MPHVYKSYKLFDQYWSGNYWNKVSIDLTEIKKCVHSSFNFLIYNLMGKFISKNPKIIYYWICWGSLYRSSHSDPVCTRYNSNLYKTLILISLPRKCTLKLEVWRKFWMTYFKNLPTLAARFLMCDWPFWDFKH